MFDVPVLEVTVSSAPTAIDSVSTINKIATLSTPQVSSALLNAAAVLPQPATVLPDIKGIEDTQDSISQPRTPEAIFQSLEPLNLSDVADSLEKVFELSLESQSLSVISNSQNESAVAVAAMPGMTEAASSPTKDVMSKPSTADITSEPRTIKPKKSTPVGLRNELTQCIDVPSGNIQDITTFQVLRQGKMIGEVSSLKGADHVARSLQAMIAPNPLEADAISPVLQGKQPAIRLGNDVLVHVTNQPAPNKESVDTATVDTATTNASDFSNEWAAIMWSDQLRRDLGATPLDAGEVQVMLKGLQSSTQNLNGLASWYGPYFHGRLTANGEIFDQNVLTAAHKSLPFNTVLQVRNLKNNRSVVVRINDRGPYIGKRSLDLSKAAAQCLGSEKTGVIPYEAVILEQPESGDSTN